MNIYDALKRDHDHHRDLMARIIQTEGDSEERRELFKRLLLDVEAHAAAEEQTLYSELIESVKGQPQTRHSVTEHKEASDLLEELKTSDMSSPGWLITFKKFKENLEHHMTEEENDVFSISQEVIEKDRAKELATKFAGRKEVEGEMLEK